MQHNIYQFLIQFKKSFLKIEFLEFSNSRWNYEEKTNLLLRIQKFFLFQTIKWSSFPLLPCL